jgi:hypothetical protein
MVEQAITLLVIACPCACNLNPVIYADRECFQRGAKKEGNT